MALLSYQRGLIEGVAACVPASKEYTRDYPWFSSLQEKKLFIQTTGIEEKRKANDNVTTSDMAKVAAEGLLSRLAWSAQEVDLLVFVSQSPDYFLPATSVVLQDRLGCRKDTMAFDINLGCSGYVYGLSVVFALMSSQGIRKALLLVGDKSTTSPNLKDRSAYPLFGDAATATAISNTESFSWFNMKSDGSGKDAIIIPAGGTRSPYSSENMLEHEYEGGIVRSKCNLHMDGEAVFSFALREVKPSVDELLHFAGIGMEKVDFMVMHQANKLINETIRRKLQLEKEKVPYSIQEFGNTSSASIPLTMVHAMREDLLTPKHMLLSGFGVGLSWGSALVQTEKVICPPVFTV